MLTPYLPDDDDTYDLGSATKEWRDIYIDGVARVDDLIVDSTVGTYATITTADIDVLDARQTNITGLAVTDIVGNLLPLRRLMPQKGYRQR